MTGRRTFELCLPHGLSSECKIVASASVDHTNCIWDVEVGLAHYFMENQGNRTRNSRVVGERLLLVLSTTRNILGPSTVHPSGDLQTGGTERRVHSLSSSAPDLSAVGIPERPLHWNVFPDLTDTDSTLETINDVAHRGPEAGCAQPCRRSLHRRHSAWPENNWACCAILGGGSLFSSNGTIRRPGHAPQLISQTFPSEERTS
ncbi:hypothetical protein BV22DRAFT_642194 [Leucogyrophana mollusca]|uniref:Uncharacterized protein n=1 Tax=Leucogyrophana mollusca TaxID=85980 RepID=A0ACB8BAD1_9AGAM|nr:hypothetical protein BV22DRAFT_642194 [Leucogyrophana mollusca]